MYIYLYIYTYIHFIHIYIYIYILSYRREYLDRHAPPPIKAFLVTFDYLLVAGRGRSSNSKRQDYVFVKGVPEYFAKKAPFTA